MIVFAYDKDGIIAIDWVPNGITVSAAYCQKFIRSVLCRKFENYSKKLTVMLSILHDNSHRMLRNQLLIYSLITWKHFSIHLIASVWVHLTSTFSKIKRTTLWNLFWKFGWAFAHPIHQLNKERLLNGIRLLLQGGA